MGGVEDGRSMGARFSGQPEPCLYMIGWQASDRLPSMVLPPVLPPPPPHLEPDVLRANEILAKGYHVARNVLNMSQPDLHQLHYHRERIQSELVPLLDVVLESTSDAATCSWCHVVTATMADLFNQLTEHEAWAQQRFEIPIPRSLPTAKMGTDKHLTVKLHQLLLSTLSQPITTHNKKAVLVKSST